MSRTSKIYEFKYTDDYIFDDSKISLAGNKLELTLPYSTNNPSIVTKYSIPLTGICSFLPNALIPENTAIKYILNKDGQDYYYNSAWVESDGSYSQANTLDEIQANFATFTTERVRLRIKVFLHSDDGNATPGIVSLELGYTFSGYCTPDDVRGLLGRAGTSRSINDEDIITSIEVADAQIKGYLSKYTLPLEEIPAQVKGFSAIIAAYNLYSSFEVAEGVTKSPHRVRYEQAIKELEDIHKGSKIIAGLQYNDCLISYSTNDDVIEDG